MIIAIIGKSNSGKTTFAEYLKNKTGIENIVACTTRPMRRTEIDGIHYNFLTREEVSNEINNGEFVEYTEYNVSDGQWIYGTRYKDIDICKNKLIVISPAGLEILKEKYGDEVLSIWIKPNNLKRIKRILQRDKGNYKEAFRRCIADYKDFKKVKADIVIKNFYLK